MVIKSVNLETVCGITSTLPENSLPEIAFAGKSNVGKSSLINGLMNRKNYARTSAQPGKTQTINFYNINNELYFVDLPWNNTGNKNEAGDHPKNASLFGDIPSLFPTFIIEQNSRICQWNRKEFFALSQILTVKEK